MSAGAVTKAERRAKRQLEANAKWIAKGTVSHKTLERRRRYRARVGKTWS